MSKLVNKLMSAQVLSNPATLLRLSKVAVEAIDPSTSMTDPYKLMQIALAVKDVPFRDFVFVQYPVVDYAPDPNRVAPNELDAAALWAALEANTSLSVTGGTGGSLTVQDPLSPEGEAQDTGSGAVDGTDPTNTTDIPVAEGITELPSTITGTSAAQNTCSDGTVSNE
ncbi:hypothetical protein GCM10009860_13520 [Microbacterium mitrae]|uniref:Uncharacterized protein n=1 Tax=Microbacterium mitrae TaxID=664640 RepID=A0A5C8HMQ6_9MICO|nr:hypothetical protein [Microbacterium mitrae]TXK03542.1 hypothetical protein FVP60_11775 [Microbacterium mitrae]